MNDRIDRNIGVSVDVNNIAFFTKLEWALYKEPSFQSANTEFVEAIRVAFLISKPKGKAFPFYVLPGLTNTVALLSRIIDKIVERILKSDVPPKEIRDTDMQSLKRDLNFFLEEDLWRIEQIISQRTESLGHRRASVVERYALSKNLEVQLSKIRGSVDFVDSVALENTRELANDFVWTIFARRKIIKDYFTFLEEEGLYDRFLINVAFLRQVCEGKEAFSSDEIEKSIQELEDIRSKIDQKRSFLIEAMFQEEVETYKKLLLKVIGEIPDENGDLELIVIDQDKDNVGSLGFILMGGYRDFLSLDDPRGEVELIKREINKLDFTHSLIKAAREMIGKKRIKKKPPRRTEVKNPEPLEIDGMGFTPPIERGYVAGVRTLDSPSKKSIYSRILSLDNVARGNTLSKTRLSIRTTMRFMVLLEKLCDGTEGILKRLSPVHSVKFLSVMEQIVEIDIEDIRETLESVKPELEEVPKLEEIVYLPATGTEERARAIHEMVIYNYVMNGEKPSFSQYNFFMLILGGIKKNIKEKRFELSFEISNLEVTMSDLKMIGYR